MSKYQHALALAALITFSPTDTITEPSAAVLVLIGGAAFAAGRKRLLKLH
jgi:hypothetical protein